MKERRAYKWFDAMQHAFEPTSILETSGHKSATDAKFKIEPEKLTACKVCSDSLPSVHDVLAQSNLEPVSRVQQVTSHGRVLLCTTKVVGTEERSDETKTKNTAAIKVMPLVRDEVWLDLFTTRGEDRNRSIANAQKAIEDSHNSAYMEPAVLAFLSSFRCPYLPTFLGAALACADRRDDLFKGRKNSGKVSPQALSCATKSTPVILCATRGLDATDAHALIEGQQMAERLGGRPYQFLPFLGHLLVALDVCHRANVIHNDVHFSNALVDSGANEDESYRYDVQNEVGDNIALVLPNPKGKRLVLIDFGRAADGSKGFVSSEIRRFEPKWDVTRKHADVAMVLASLLRHWPSLAKGAGHREWPSSWDTPEEALLAVYVSRAVNCSVPASVDDGIKNSTDGRVRAESLMSLPTCFIRANTNDDRIKCEHRMAHSLRGASTRCSSITAGEILCSDLFARYRDRT